MRDALWACALLPLAASACGADTTHLHVGPYAGYDIESVTTEARAIGETGVYAILRRFQVSPVGGNAQFLTTVIDVENRTDFAYCARLGVASDQPEAAIADEGVVIVAPHAVRSAVAIVSGMGWNLRELRGSTDAKAWPADREGSCGAAK